MEAASSSKDQQLVVFSDGVLHYLVLTGGGDQGRQQSPIWPIHDFCLNRAKEPSFDRWEKYLSLS